jgi:hypothetical protein
MQRLHEYAPASEPEHVRGGDQRREREVAHCGNDQNGKVYRFHDYADVAAPQRTARDIRHASATAVREEPSSPTRVATQRWAESEP